MGPNHTQPLTVLMAAEDSASRKVSQLGISNLLLCHANIIIHGQNKTRPV